VTQLNPGSHNDAVRNEGIQKAEIEEVLMCFVTLGALLPVLKSELEGAVALSCHMFTIEKFLANGEHDKFKARIVAHGNEQDTLLYPDQLSPTASMQASMACLAIAAYNRNFRLAKIDIKGAFIQTDMKGRPVFIRCNKKLTQLIVDIIPGIQRYICKDGTVYCRLLKALYGCVQVSKLWYEKLSSFLKLLGYERCPVEPCVIRRIENGVVYTLLICVDDILVIGDDKEFERLRAEFMKEFRWIMMEVSNVLSYLGMLVELHDGYVIIDMLFSIEKILKDYEDFGKQGTPGSKSTFEVDESAEVLSELEKKKFHMTVAKLLYLCKRARPDIMMVVSFLCTRMKGPTVEDKVKLIQLLEYLNRTKNYKYRVEPKGLFRVEVYIDASFGTHGDSKSHTGSVVFVAGAPVVCASRKQRCVTKSPTEAELVGLSDNLANVEVFTEFLEFVLNQKLSVPTVYQDNTSVISLVTSGGGITRTKHLRARMKLVKEAVVDRKMVKVVYMPTERMVADGLTKVLEGLSFIEFAKLVLGKTRPESQPVGVSNLFLCLLCLCLDFLGHVAGCATGKSGNICSCRLWDGVYF
jgi:hypothetical protein